VRRHACVLTSIRLRSNGISAEGRFVSIEATSGVVPDFVQDGLASRVVFGNGATAELPDQADRLGITSALTVCTPSLHRRASRLSRALADRPAGLLHTVGTEHQADPVAKAERIAHTITGQGAPNGVLAVGGAAAMVVARQIGGLTGLPVLALPTSYAGRETSAERADAPLPLTIVYDPVLTTTLPVHVTATSTVAAIARACLVLCSGAGSPLTEMTAAEAIRYLTEGARDAVLHPRGLVGRSRLLYGAHLVGVAIAGAGKVAGATVHRACALDDAVARAAGLHPSDVTAALLPHRLAAAGSQRPLALAAVATSLRADDAVTGMRALAAELGAPTSFADLELDSERWGRAAATARADTERLDLPLAERKALDDALSAREPA
jgi:maleylacetate reductase